MTWQQFQTRDWPLLPCRCGRRKF